MRAVRVVISGRVQGVWYRGWTVDQALKRNLDGWVRNRDDGTVEALFAGEQEDIDDMIESCWDGPSMARVVNVEVSPVDPPEYRGFRQVDTV